MSHGFIDLLSFLQGGFAGVLPNAYVPISFPLTPPSTPGIKRITWKMIRSSVRSTSEFSLISQVQEFSGRKLEASVTMPEMNRDQAEAWNAFLLMLDGDRGTFLLGDPAAKTPRGAWLGTPVVAAGNNAGSSILVLEGLTPNIADQVRAGDWIQLPNYRIHKCLRDADSSNDGQVTLDVWPHLRQAYPQGSAVITSNTKGQFRMKDSSYTTWESDERQIFGISFECEEAL